MASGILQKLSFSNEGLRARAHARVTLFNKPQNRHARARARYTERKQTDARRGRTCADASGEDDAPYLLDASRARGAFLNF